jgi:hypothetical protein
MLQCMRALCLVVVGTMVVGTMVVACGHATVEPPARPVAAAGGPLAECQGSGGTSEACCEALADRARGLVGAGQRQPAIAAYEDARHRCPRSNSIRRMLFLARHPEAEMPAADWVPVETQVDLEYAVTLAPDLRPVWQACFLDGEPLLKGHRRLITGKHEVEAEVYVTSAKDPDGPVFRVATMKTFVLPRYLADKGDLAGAVKVIVTDRGGSAPPPARVGVDVEVSRFHPPDIAAKP